ncbi:hypothetical protein [Bacterioplanes sanyensis]|uniref:hypothetical protein n=1 Tax=Bacterioplanes sanyensis TaxID=1249553 RepID=UPI0012FE6B18|nr:hypothetical protein [Bacterioplanes sanyensis]
MANSIQLLTVLLLGISSISWAADPTRPPQWSPSSAPSAVVEPLQLQQIIWREDVPVAVINQQVVTSGQQIDGALLERIGRNYVVVRQGGQQRRLELLTSTKTKVQ